MAGATSAPRWSPHASVAESYKKAGAPDLTLSVAGWVFPVHRALLERQSEVVKTAALNSGSATALSLPALRDPMAFGKTMDCVYRLADSPDPAFELDFDDYEAVEEEVLPAYVRASVCSAMHVAAVAHFLLMERIVHGCFDVMTRDDNVRVAWNADPAAFESCMNSELVRGLYARMTSYMLKAQLVSVALKWCAQDVGPLFANDLREFAQREDMPRVAKAVDIVAWGNHIPEVLQFIPGDVIVHFLRASYAEHVELTEEYEEEESNGCADNPVCEFFNRPDAVLASAKEQKAKGPKRKMRAM